MDTNNAKSCGTCKHFEPSTEWRRGWCRNTLLYAPSQSHSVQSEELDCSRGALSFWEAGTSRPQENAGQPNVKLPTFENPLKLLSPAFAGPTPAGAGATGGNMMFASSGSGSGGGGFDDDDYGYDDDFGYDDETPEQEPAPSRPQSNRTRRSAGRANADGGRSRTASNQPEERYWTDYLRIALPVIGIILMLGVLWIWASSLLGGDDNDVDVTPTDTVAEVETQPADPNEVNTEPNGVGTPAPTQPANTAGGEIPISGGDNASTPGTNTEPGTTFNPTQNETPAAGGDNTAGEETTTEEEPPADTGGEITVDSRVAITEVVNIRPSAGTSGEPIGEGAVGEEGTVLSGPEEADGFVWWELVFDDGSSGFVAEDFLELVP